MLTNQQWCCLTPEIKVVAVEIENGFIGSNMESIGDEKPEQEW